MKKQTVLQEFCECSNPEDKLQFLNNLDFPILIKEKKDLYYAFIPTLSLSCEGKQVDDCYSKIKELKEQHFRRLIETDSAEDVLFSNPHFFLIGEFNRIKLKIFNYLVTTLFIVGITLFLGWQITAVFSRMAFSVTELLHKDVARIQDEVKNLRGASVEKKKERIEKFKTSLREFKPYSDAVREVIFEK